MALVACTECGGNVSTSAIRCPHCGYPIAGKRLLESAKSITRNILQTGTEQISSGRDGYLIEPAKADAILSNMQPPKAPWSLTRINGIGFHMGKPILLARIDSKLIAIAPQYFTFLFIPLLCVGWHVVQVIGEASAMIGLKYREFLFLGRIDGATCRRLLGGHNGKTSFLRELGGGLWVATAIALIVLVFAFLRQVFRG